MRFLRTDAVRRIRTWNPQSAFQKNQYAQSRKGPLLQNSPNGMSLIMRGEAPMAHSQFSECVGRSLRDIRPDVRP